MYALTLIKNTDIHKKAPKHPTIGRSELFGKFSTNKQQLAHFH
jgi:hypothetical protein